MPSLPTRVIGGSVMPGGAWPVGVTILGVEQLARRLEYLEVLGGRKVVLAGARAAMPVLAKGFKAVVNATVVAGPYVPPGGAALKREVRKAIGWRFVRGGLTRMGKSLQPIAKAGVAVGKVVNRQKRIRSAVAARKRRIARGVQQDRGVGISLNNVHWAVLGTHKRRHKTDGKKTGRMPDFFRGLGERAVTIAGPMAMNVAVQAMKMQLIKEAKAQFRKSF